MIDALDIWLKTRTTFDLTQVKTVSGPITPLRDGHKHFIDTHAKSRNESRAYALNTALDQVRVDATLKKPLTFEQICFWQKIILNSEDVSFRKNHAFAKGGRERYWLAENTKSLFEDCLEEANATDISVIALAARAYFDIMFFHPFEDGNSRCAALTLDFILSRESIYLNQVAPLFVVERAPSLSAINTFVKLLELLVKQSICPQTQQSFAQVESKTFA